ncbi:MAG: hypothetical protein Q8P24_02485 [Desulfobacterales bacterium]|nr:hypothetical protein [Desulfobacterales bacterium]
MIIKVSQEEALPIIEKYISQRFVFNTDPKSAHGWTDEDQDGKQFFCFAVAIPEGEIQ